MLQAHQQDTFLLTRDDIAGPGHPPLAEKINLAEFFMGPNRFLLKAQGDSMIEAGILDGDIVIAERGGRVDDGDIVVALIDGNEAILRRLRTNSDGSISLFPANAAQAPRRYAPGHVTIQGRLVAQLRSYR